MYKADEIEDETGGGSSPDTKMLCPNFYRYVTGVPHQMAD
jgi:hypothetical protein